MALPQRDQLPATISSNKGWTCSPRGLLQQPGSSRRPLETTARAHLYHAQETLLCSVISSVTFLLTDVLPDPQQLSWAQVRRQREFFSSEMAATGGRLRTWSACPHVMLKRASQGKCSFCETRNSYPDLLVGCWLSSSLYWKFPACIFAACSTTCSEVDPDATCQ